MKIKGIKRGTMIELFEEIDIPDGSEVTIELESKTNLNQSERLRMLNQLFGVWKDQPELDEIFAEIDRERHAYRGIKIESLDD